MEAEDLSALLNEYLSEMAEIAQAFGATVNQFVGDGIMIIFGAPEATNDRDHAVRAVRMALAMQQRMARLRDKWFTAGIQTPFRTSIVEGPRARRAAPAARFHAARSSPGFGYSSHHVSSVRWTPDYRRAFDPIRAGGQVAFAGNGSS